MNLPVHQNSQTQRQKQSDGYGEYCIQKGVVQRLQKTLGAEHGGVVFEANPLRICNQIPFGHGNDNRGNDGNDGEHKKPNQIRRQKGKRNQTIPALLPLDLFLDLFRCKGDIHNIFLLPMAFALRPQVYGQFVEMHGKVW